MKIKYRMTIGGLVNGSACIQTQRAGTHVDMRGKKVYKDDKAGGVVENIPEHFKNIYSDLNNWLSK